MGQVGFIENKGQVLDQNHQANPGVKFLYSSPGFNVQLRKTGFSYDTYTDDSLNYIGNSAQTPAQDSALIQVPVRYSRHYHRVDVELPGCNTSAEMVPEVQSASYYNYLTTGVPAGGVTFVHNYQRVVYKDIYPQIDLVFYIKPSGKQPVKGIPGVEYDFIVHPGGDVNAIRLAYSGANAVNLQNGQLNIQVASGAFAEMIPNSYIRQSGEAVDVRYRSISHNVYSFSLPEGFKNNSSDLVIDPSPCLLWGTYYGGISADYAVRTTVDAAGNSYLSGSTSSAAGIATAGANRTNFEASMDVFVSKFNSAGALIWGTYYGGEGSDLAIGIATDTAGNVYLTGSTTSTTGIATTGAYQTAYAGGTTYGDAFVAEFNPTGTSLLWGTYYGGPADDAGGGGVRVDKYGHVYVGGFTSSTTGIATPGAYLTVYPGGSANAYVAEFNPALTGTAQLVWGTYYGGAVYEHAKGLAIDNASNVYMTGTTESPGIATTGAYQTTYEGSSDVFVAKFSSTGTLVWSTYYGGPSINDGYRIAVDDAQNVFFAGYTYSATGIATPGAYQTAIGSGESVYLAELNSSGNSLLWGTYYNGYYFGYTVGYIEFIDLAIAVDANSNLYVAGGTTTAGQATPGAYQTTLNGTFNVYVAKFDTAAQLIWDTYYGGNNGSIANGIGLDADDNVYVSGSGNSTNGIATPGAFQDSLAGSTDIFVAKFGCNNPLPVAQFTASDAAICIDNQVNFADQSTGNPASWNWTFSGGTPGSSTTQNPTVTYDTAGIYPVKLVITNASGSDSLTKVSYIIVSGPPLAGTVAGPNTVCSGSPVRLSDTEATGSLQWQYSPDGISFAAIAGDTLSSATIAAPSQTSYYRVSVSGSCGADTSAVFKLSINALPVPVVTAPDSVICSGGSSALCTTQPFVYYFWSTGDTSSCTTAKVAGGYWVSVADVNGCAAVSAPRNIDTFPATPRPLLSTNDSLFCSSDSTKITTSGSYASYLWNTGDTSSSIYTNEAGGYWVTVTDVNGCSAESGHQDISVYPVPSVSIVVEGNTLSSYGQLSYRWSFNGVPLNGDTGAAIEASQSGLYSVQITDSNGCTNTSSSVLVATGINDLTGDERVSIYPNPSIGSWQLSVDNELVGSSMEIYDEQGRLVFRSEIRDPRSEMTLDVASGVYYLRIANNNAILVKKLIKL